MTFGLLPLRQPKRRLKSNQLKNPMGIRGVIYSLLDVIVGLSPSLDFELAGARSNRLALDENFGVNANENKRAL